MSNEAHSLLMAFWHDVQQPDTFWQTGVLVACLAVAWLAQRLVREHAPAAEGAWKLGHGGLRRIAFPLVALTLVYVAQQLLQQTMHGHGPGDVMGNLFDHPALCTCQLKRQGFEQPLIQRRFPGRHQGRRAQQVACALAL